MRYDFDPQIAKDYGVEEAIMYSNIVWWCHKNATERSEAHFFDGKYWTWNTEAAWAELFGFWNKEQIGRIMKNLTEGVSKKRKAKKGESGIAEKFPPIVDSRFKGFKKQRYFRPINPGYTEHECEKANAVIREGNCLYPKGLMPESYNKEQIVQNTESQGVPRPPKKIEAYEKTEDIPDWQSFPPATIAVFTALYELGWKLPKSRDIKKMRDDLGDHLRLCGLLYKNAQGYEQLAELEMKTEARRFVTYWQGQQEQGKGKKDYWATFLNRCNQIHEYRTKKQR